MAGVVRQEQERGAADLPVQSWEVRKPVVGRRPQIVASPSVATVPDQPWATDLCRRVWGGRDGRLTLALVLDCHARQLQGRQLSRNVKASTAAAALERVLITRYGTLGRVPGRPRCARTTAWCAATA